MKDRCKCGAWSALDHEACPKCGEQVDVHGCEKCAASVMIWDARCYACGTPNPRYEPAGETAREKELVAGIQKFISDFAEVRWGYDGHCGSQALVDELETYVTD